jgi:serine/threonine protein phosphatase PrpC
MWRLLCGGNITNWDLKIKIKNMRLSSYSNIGKRELNEDFITYRTMIYVLCDGVGGEENGEVASRFVAEKFADYFDKERVEIADISLIQDALKRIQIELNDRLSLFPYEHGMGTTIAAILFVKGAVFLIHIGDSRIYYIRPSEGNYWHTTDHSVITELINSGLINEKEARTHPMKNRITRAIQSNFNGKTALADIKYLPDVQAGDLLFLCSDGVLEGLSESALLEILCNRKGSVIEKINKVKHACMGVSSDNNSALLLEVESDDGFALNQENDIVWKKISFEKSENLSGDVMDFSDQGLFHIGSLKTNNNSKPALSRISRIISIAIVTFLILIIATYTFSFCRRQKTAISNSINQHATETLINRSKNISDPHSIKVEASPKSL